MRKALLTIFSLLICTLALRAQNEAPVVDSLYAGQTAVDSTLVGRDIFKMLSTKSRTGEGSVTIEQSQSVAGAMRAHIRDNADKKISGYRIRIYFDNKQNARTKSEQVADEFKARHPGVGVYREYANPYFKVTVGDFRTKEDAKQFLSLIKAAYPSGFIVREKINFPIM